MSMLAAGLLAGCHPTDSGEGDTVKLRTDVFHTGASLPFLVGVDRGIYRRHGVDVTINPGKGSATTIQTVANGSDDIGYADAGTMVQSIAKGMQVRMVAGMVQESPYAIFAKSSSDIRQPADLAGGSAGYVPGSAPERLFPAYANAAGITPDSVTLPRVDVPTRDSLFLRDRVNFSFGLLNVTSPLLRSKCDCKLWTLPYSDAGIHALSSGIVVSDEFAKEHPDTLRKFLAATAEATRFATEHPEKGVRSFFDVDSTSKLTPAIVRKQWAATVRLRHTQHSKGQPFGCTTRTDWENTISLMEQYANVEPTTVTPETAATNTYLPTSCGKSPATGGGHR